MQFGAPLPNWIAVYPTPNIYHLVELKDNYHRYIVLFALPDRASIMEVNLGAVTTQAWINKPNLRKRVSQEWGKQHYQIHQTHRGSRFLLEKIQVLKLLMRAGGHTHLILAGDPEITESIRLALPKNLTDKLVDVIPACKRDQEDDIVMATLSSFIEHEEQESQTVTENLIEGLRSQSLAVAGTKDTLNVLRWGEVDTLIMASDYQPDPGWTCTTCRAIGIELPKTSTCPQCGALNARPLDIREALLRLAGQLKCTVEIVEHSDALMTLGGVGCLLRTHFDTTVEDQVTHQKFDRNYA
jgi:rubrerythrin